MRLSTKERQRLIEANVPFVRSIAFKLKEQLPREIEFDDLYNYGVQGLLEAAERYQRKYGVNFQTFAYYRVRGAMYDGLRAMGWLPRHEYQRLRLEEHAAQYLANLAERDAGATAAAGGDLDAAVNFEDEVRRIAEALGGVAAIFVATVGTSSEGDTAAGTEASPQLAMEAKQRDRAVEAALTELPERERELLRLYYYEDKPLDEVGRLMGLSKSWLSRLHARAIDLLKESLRNQAVRPEGDAADPTIKRRAKR